MLIPNYWRIFSGISIGPNLSTNYFIFNPFDPKSLQGWHLKNYQYQELQPNDKGWLWCDKLGLWLGTWEGTIRDESAVWLRFYDQQGNLVLDFGEQQHQRAEEQQQRAERLAAKLKELGIDPDSV
ncbi:hypothetical protein [Okeania sp.]|uniref:hypothetical protein n=1 Tax=Okeania sp. TaxID=3100323 RepID=UPI002B4B54B7|nr:hypothetical protein [Okeania sp.]MEB3342046.1 hypothetical protein [Okeania sp.]